MTDHKNIRMKDSIESFGRKPAFSNKNTSMEIEEQFVDQQLATGKPPRNKDEALIQSVQKILNDIKAQSIDFTHEKIPTHVSQGYSFWNVAMASTRVPGMEGKVMKGEFCH